MFQWLLFMIKIFNLFIILMTFFKISGRLVQTKWTTSSPSIYKNNIINPGLLIPNTIL